MKHTPGPWSFEPHADSRRDGYIRGPERVADGLASVAVARACHSGRGVSEMRANARLIAAAPELLAALGGLIVGLMRDYPCVAMGMNDWEPIVQARAAIARAKS